MDTLFLEGTREKLVLLEVKDMAAFLAFLHWRDLFIQGNLFNGACTQRAEDLKTLQRDMEGFAGFSSVPSANRAQQSRDIFPESVKITVNQGGSLNLSFQRRQ